MSKLVAIRYEVGSEAEAGLIFEVMNDRGRPLSQLDKVKNYLMYLSYKGGDNDLARSINESWGEILRNTAETKTKGFNEDTLLRYHWVIYHGETKESDVHRQLKNTLTLGTPGVLALVRTYVDSLKKVSYVLRELGSLEAAFADWTDNGAAAMRECLAGLHRLEVTAVFMPLLTASRIVLRDAPSLFQMILRGCEVFALRVYKVANRRADTGQSTFYWHAHRLFLRRGQAREELEKLCDEVLSDIKSYIARYCSESEFDAGLRKNPILQFMGSYEVRYILYELEKKKCGDAGEAPPSWEGLEKASIEHIWAENPKGYKEWPEHLQQVHSENCGRLGNLTLTFWNPELSNRDFVEKRVMFSKSNLRIQRELASRASWGQHEIDERTNEILGFASVRWKAPA